MSSWRPTRPMVRRTVLGLVLLLVLGLGGPLSWGWYQERQDREREQRARCADGVVRRGPLAECVGVSAQDFAFTPELADVQRLISDENKRVVREEDDYVTIAYMTSLTLEEDDSNSHESVRRQLQGAYLAQYRANHGDLTGRPAIRLLVANTGSNSGQWKFTVDRLVELSRSEDRKKRLLAVAGLGPSTQRNKQALERLSRHGIAMVGSNMTDTGFAGIPGLVRVAPTNEREAEAAAEYLKDRGFETSVIVRDEAEENLYAASLAKEFRSAFPDDEHSIVAEASGYDASRPDWETDLYWISRTLCDQAPDVVYFAGRGKHLKAFLNSLANRTCQNRDFTVMGGDDVTNLTNEDLVEAAEKGVEVLYTGLAHPGMWEKDKAAVSKPSADFFRDGGWMSETFPNDPRTDGQAIVSHDATLTAVQGVRMAAHGGSDMTGESVGRMFQLMRGEQQRVPGAGGFLSFHRNGDPVDKAVPVLKLHPDGHFQLDDVVHADSG
ncbi:MULTISPECIES: ABC transporter substrate-binding protein [Streptomyces]|uniref:ABC transporter substrate-binding protein n=1 Tax=Streptomyces lycii TaxID=2654337 RepID=A0ABQ7FBI3_9ACTN|nr:MULTISPECIES: ABC transporter substrate-binding protein [Streptomyces]KAF4406331.1 ABC transporter substrate-binding protein [Streptomyces lycii]PGH47646.1 branched-chain amino acid ABC transporter substrate-binding protein [Streptomyces sp. Ru87]